MVTNSFPYDVMAGPVLLMLTAGAFLIFFVPIAQIIHKAGYSRLWILVWFVPLLNIVMLWVFAFSRWPVENKN